MSDFSTQLQQMMQAMMRPSQMMNIETGNPAPGSAPSVDSWQHILNPKGDNAAMGRLAEIAGAKNIGEGAKAAGALMGK